MTWVQYFYHNVPNIVWAFFTIFLITKLFKPEQPIDAKDYVCAQYKKLGRMTVPEKKGVFVTTLLLVFLLTAQYHNINIGWGFAIAGCLMYLPGINIGTEDDIKRISFSPGFLCHGMYGNWCCRKCTRFWKNPDSYRAANDGSGWGNNDPGPGLAPLRGVELSDDATGDLGFFFCTAGRDGDKPRSRSPHIFLHNLFMLPTRYFYRMNISLF